jgi:hypothetical protein
MKSTLKLTLIVFLLFTSFFSSAEPQSPDQKLQTLSSEVQQIKKDIGNVKSNIDAIENKVPEKKTICPECCGKTLGWIEWTFILLPAIILLITMLGVQRMLKRSDFKLSDALTADEPEEKKTISRDAATNNIIQNTTETILVDGKPIYSKSTSRLIVFLSGLATIVISVYLVCYHAYFSIKGCAAPDFKNLTEIILSLGLGLVPYAINKITAPTPANK